jgi:hypothetical protein
MRRGLATGAVAAISAGLPLSTSLGPAMASQVAHAGHSAPVKYYVVRQSWHHQQEFLYEIAQRFLGNGNLYPEIFNLNKGRLQPDGQRLTNPTDINAGWILELPANASGRGVQYGPLPTVATRLPSGSNPGGSNVPGSSQAGRTPSGSGPGGALLGSGIALFAVAVPGGVILLRRRRQATARTGRDAARDADSEPTWTPQPDTASDLIPETAWTPQPVTAYSPLPGMAPAATVPDRDRLPDVMTSYPATEAKPAIPDSLEPEQLDTASWWSATLEDDGSQPTASGFLVSQPLSVSHLGCNNSHIKGKLYTMDP